MNTNRQWLLAQRPQGMVGKDNFTYAEQAIPEAGDGQVLVRNLYLSFDPTQRGWMEDRESYLPPVGIGEPMRAGSIGQVVESRHAEFCPGGFGANYWRLARLCGGSARAWADGIIQGA